MCCIFLDEYFDKTPVSNKCFCDDCHKARGDRECYSRGNPSMTYALPIGWSRFPIKYEKVAMSLHAFKNLIELSHIVKI